MTDTDQLPDPDFSPEDYKRQSLIEMAAQTARARHPRNCEDFQPAGSQRLVFCDNCRMVLLQW